MGMDLPVDTVVNKSRSIKRIIFPTLLVHLIQRKDAVISYDFALPGVDMSVHILSQLAFVWSEFN